MIVDKYVDLDGELIRLAADSMPAEDDEEVTTRTAVSQSVQTWLPVVVATLKAAGLVHGATGQRRPRRFDLKTWELLESAGEQVDVARVALLRCCLQLQAQHGDSVAPFIRLLAKQVRETERQVREDLGMEA